MRPKQYGQTLIEVVVAVAIATAVVSALALASTNSIRNAQFSKNQSQATKLSQEAIEYLRSYRDRYGFDALLRCVTTTGTYRTLNQVEVPASFDTSQNCYYASSNNGQAVESFRRFVEITSGDNNTVNIKVWVDWSDVQGSHTRASGRAGSELQTVLTRWRY